MTEILTGIFSFILGGGLAVIVTLKAKKDQATAETDKVEMDNFRTGTQLLMETIVQPLKEELQEARQEVRASKEQRIKDEQVYRQLKNEVSKLRKAIEKISNCPHAAHCPVTAEIKQDEQIN